MMENLKIEIYADGADLKQMYELNKMNFIKGFTTNPSLMRKAGVTDYKKFAVELLSQIKDKPISFEVFSDEIEEMGDQAREIASWGKNVFVKIPVTNTKGESTANLVNELSNKGVNLNITAIFTLEQLDKILEALNSQTQAILSVFAGRIADSGIDPSNIISQSVSKAKVKPKSKILWASTREIINIYQADNLGCQIITVPHNLLSKLSNIGKNLEKFSLETVLGFYKDAKSAGYSINSKKKND